jgi:tannase/feruloyl esterase
MQHFKFDMRAWTQLASLLAATSLFSAGAIAAKMAGDPAATCSDLIRPTDNAVRVESAAMIAPTPLAVVERGPTPAARVTPANPEFCKVLGQIAPSDPNAPPIKFQVNLPIEWNGRSLQYGGGGFNGVLITGLALPPAMRPSRASRRRCLRSTTRRSRILRIDPTSACGMRPSR